MNRPVTQIFTDLSQMQDWAPLAPTPAPGQMESQPFGAHKSMMGVKHRSEQDLPNTLRTGRRLGPKLGLA